MAIYEYFCGNCNSKFELNFPIGKAEEKADCPSCKGLSRRIFSSFFLFSRGKESLSGISSRSSCSSCMSRNCSSCNF